jgi:hypothetical protein
VSEAAFHGQWSAARVHAPEMQVRFLPAVLPDKMDYTNFYEVNVRKGVEPGFLIYIL